mgnify:CR=1 FL=1
MYNIIIKIKEQSKQRKEQKNRRENGSETDQANRKKSL